jgi:glycine cleavage system H protein
MTFFLLFLTLAILLILELVKGSKQKAVPSGSSLPREVPSSLIGQRYFHPGHSWISVDSAEQVTVGVDDFSQNLLGKLSGVTLPNLGTVVKQGEVIGSLRRGDKTLPQISPLSGTIVDINSKLARNPGLVNESPMEIGWTVKIAPWSLAREIRNLLRGDAVRQWQGAVRDQLLRWFSQSHVPVMQDGGAMIDNVSDIVNDQQWQKLVEEFFQVTIENKKQQST